MTILDEARKELATKKKLEEKKSTSVSATANPKQMKAKNKKGAKGGEAQPNKSTQKTLRRKMEPQEATALPRKTCQAEVQSLCQRTRKRKARL